MTLKIGDFGLATKFRCSVQKKKNYIFFNGPFIIVFLNENLQKCINLIKETGELFSQIDEPNF